VSDALPPRDPRRQVVSGSLAWAEMVLRDQEMPPDEIRVVLTIADRDLVRRHLELHMERLEEWLITQRRSVEAVELLLAEPPQRPRVATRLTSPDGSAARAEAPAR
jgi:hypothetical protein